MTYRQTELTDIMPGWNGTESIVAYSIRQRRERERLAALRRLQTQLALVCFTPLILAGIVAASAYLFTLYSAP